MANSTKRLMEYVAANGGVVTRAEALALGMSSTTLKRWVRDGRLVKVATGTYVLPGVLASERTLLHAATSALDAVASHESAARLHRLDGLNPRRVSVTVPARRSNRFADVVVHQSTDLIESDQVEISSLPATDIVRTIIDLAAFLGEKRLAMILDQAVRMRLTTYEQVAERLASLARRGKPGVVKLRRVLVVRLGKKFISDSTLETMSLQLILDAGLPMPTPQYRPPWLKAVNGRVDLAYVEEKIIVEFDGARWHGNPEAFQTDRERDNLAQLAGWIVLRFTWQDVTERPSYVVESIRQALMKRSRGQIRPPQH